MCGLTGVLLGSWERTERELTTISDMFSRLLVLSEHRGPYATGAALISARGDVNVEKAPVPAHHFIGMDTYKHMCARIDPRTTILMGHTRWPTQGTHYLNYNNQPLTSSGSCCLALTHNGDIPQVNRHFARFCLTREWEVDSELLLRLACRNSTLRGIEILAFLRDLSVCPGHLAAVLVAASQPKTIVMLRRDRPLFTAWHPTGHLLAYASERQILSRSITEPEKWQIRAMPPNSAWIFSCNDLSMPEVLTL